MLTQYWRSLWMLTKGVARRWWLLTLAILVDPVDALRLFGLKFHVEPPTSYGLIAFLFLLSVTLAYHDLARRLPNTDAVVRELKATILRTETGTAWGEMLKQRNRLARQRDLANGYSSDFISAINRLGLVTLLDFTADPMGTGIPSRFQNVHLTDLGRDLLHRLEHDHEAQKVKPEPA